VSPYQHGRLLNDIIKIKAYFGVVIADDIVLLVVHNKTKIG